MEPCRLGRSCVTTCLPSLPEEQASTATFTSSSSKRESSTSRRMSGRCHGEHYALNIQKGNQCSVCYLCDIKLEGQRAPHTVITSVCSQILIESFHTGCLKTSTSCQQRTKSFEPCRSVCHQNNHHFVHWLLILLLSCCQGRIRALCSQICTRPTLQLSTVHMWCALAVQVGRHYYLDRDRLAVSHKQWLLL